MAFGGVPNPRAKGGGRSIDEKLVGGNITIVLSGAFPRFRADVEKGGGWMQKSDTFVIEFAKVE